MTHNARPRQTARKTVPVTQQVVDRITNPARRFANRALSDAHDIDQGPLERTACCTSFYGSALIDAPPFIKKILAERACPKFPVLARRSPILDRQRALFWRVQ
jgi:hypothetical protein